VLVREQDGLCFYCHEPMTTPLTGLPPLPRDATLDHLIPRSEGGRHRFPNEVAACHRCNGERGTMPWLLFYCLKEIERDARRDALRPRQAANDNLAQTP
jgi:hypothetical protein